MVYDQHLTGVETPVGRESNQTRNHRQKPVTRPSAVGFDQNDTNTGGDGFTGG